MSRQLYEEALHVQFYLTLLDTYLPDPEERFAAFAAVERIPSVQRKGEFCFKWIDSIPGVEIALETRADRRKFLLNLICFAACIEGLFFFAAFALRRRFPPLARPLERSRGGHELGLPRRERAHEVRVQEGGFDRAARKSRSYIRRRGSGARRGPDDG